MRNIPLVAVVAALLVGCLISEADEYRIVLNADGKSGTIYTVKRNIQSDQDTHAKQQEDFDNLIRDWKGDSYLLEKMKEGVYVKDRNLSIEGGDLVWKEVAIFADFHELFRDAVINDTVRIGFGNDQTVAATNGELIRTKDSTVVQWPPKTTEFILKVRKNDFRAASNFVERFTLYTRQNQNQK